MNTTGNALAGAGGSDFPSYALFFGAIACLHGLALALNLWNYAGWWQLIQEQYRKQYVSLRRWRHIGWACALLGGGLLAAGLTRLVVP
ncbi:hypothetical protein BX265_8145 [Streptomyces sp. TLI_235]|nr:hypothetical protein [Streptomyces sp. TLI_235]PBC67536.1 hypothetical protein BX265_8145 [Streptomyces sp. TLI_235]